MFHYRTAAGARQNIRRASCPKADTKSADIYDVSYRRAGTAPGVLFLNPSRSNAGDGRL